MNAYYKVGRFIVWLVGHLWFGVRLRGREHLPVQGTFLLASNHESMADPPLIGLGPKRDIAYLARESLFRGLLGFWLRKVGVIPLERGASDRAALRKAREVLETGAPLLMFPEGTRTRDGEVGVFHRGVLLLARQAGVPIVPVAIEGARRAFPPGARFPRPRRIQIAYGAPIQPDELQDIGAEGLRERVVELRRGLEAG